jgi:CRISPR/Cas system-associated exonuclease Cas4 (RecB family)
MFDDRKPAPIRNLSVSKIEKFMLCPKNFELSYIHKIPQPNAWKPFAGTVVHEIIEMAIRQFARTGVYPDWKTMDDQYEPVWKEKVEETEGRDTFICWQDDPEDPLETLKPDYRKLIRVAREEVLPTIKPWMIDGVPVVEHRIDLEVRTRVGPCPIIGYADLLDASGVLIDWKSTGKEVSERAKGTWLQFAAYSLWAYPLTGEENLRCEKIFLVRGEGNPRVERVPFMVGEKHREYFVKLAAQVWETIHHKIFIANPDTWLCKPLWCPYFAGCMGDLKKKEEALCPIPSPSPSA